MTAMKLHRYGASRFGKIGAGARMVRSSPPPPGARWVEYLESTGTQYIDTGAIPSPACKFIIDAWFKSDTQYGSLASGIARFHAYIPFCVRNQYLGTNIIYPFGRRAVVELNNKVGHFKFEDVELLYTPREDPGAPEFCLFARNFNGVVDKFDNGAKLYAFDWWDDADAEKSMSLRPIAIGNTGYMLDLVSGEYLPYGNAGTGDFVIGPDIPSPI